MSNSEFLYEGYLTEKKSKSVIEKVFGGYTVTPQKKFKNENLVKQMSFDFFIEELNIAIEFNGDSHYTSSDVMIRDVLKWTFCVNNDIHHVEIPYFVQLDFEMIYFFFHGYDSKVNSNIIDIFNNYEEPEFPQGFITNTIKLPASFSPKGQKKFMNEMCALTGTDCFIGVVNSLMDKVERKEERFGSVNKTQEEAGFDPFLLAWDSVVGMETFFTKEFFPTINGTTNNGALEDQNIDSLMESLINKSRTVRHPDVPLFNDCCFPQDWPLTNYGVRSLQTHHLPL